MLPVLLLTLLLLILSEFGGLAADFRRVDAATGLAVEAAARVTGGEGSVPEAALPPNCKPSTA